MNASQKAPPLTKSEVTLLLDLITNEKSITSKATNAANNLLKDESWLKVTESFNANISSCPRRTAQLRLKWENLKKAARKRSSRIKLNNSKTGGGKPDFIPPDESLDRVAAILGATCDGYNVQFGGDAVEILEFNTIVEEAAELGNNTTSTAVVCGDRDKVDRDKVDQDSVIIEEDKENLTLPVTPTPSVLQPKKFFFTSAKSVIEENERSEEKPTNNNVARVNKIKNNPNKVIRRKQLKAKSKIISGQIKKRKQLKKKVNKKKGSGKK